MIAQKIFKLIFLPDCPFSLSRRFSTWTGTWSMAMSNLIRNPVTKNTAPIPPWARSSKPDELVIVESIRQNAMHKLMVRDKAISLCAPGNITTFPLRVSHLTGKQAKYPPHCMFRLIKVISLLSILNLFRSSLPKVYCGFWI